MFLKLSLSFLPIRIVSLHFVLLVFVLFLATACKPGKESYTAMFTQTVYQPAYATGFRILGAEGKASTVLEVTNPWQNAQGVKMAYFLARNGEQAPEGFEGVVVPAGARRIVCMSSSYVGMLDELGEVERVVGASGVDFITNTYVASHKDRIRDVGAEMDFEVLLGLKPDLVLLYGVDDEQASLTDKLGELSVPYLYIGEYLEESPLGRAEWMVALAEVLDCRTKGEQVFAGIPVRYDACRRLVADVAERPTVMLNMPWSDVWSMPSQSSYMARLIRDAGGAYIYTKAKPGTYDRIGMETAYMLLDRADYWLNVNNLVTLDELKAADPRFARAKVVKEHRVYNNNRRLTPAGGNDFWESSVVHPDRILKDLIGIFHPEVSGASDSLYYYRRLE